MSNSFEDRNDAHEPRKGNRSFSIVLLLLLLASVGFNIYFMAKTAKVEEKEEKLSTELFSSGELRKSLQDKLDSINSELNSMRGRGDELDNLINEKDKDLKEKAAKITALLKSNKINYNKFLAAKEEIDKLQYYADKYLEDVKRLEAENKKLANENTTLKDDLTTKERAIDEMTDEVIKNRNKLEVASKIRIDPEEINISGVSISRRGKESETSRAKNFDKIRFKYFLPKNLAASAGKKSISFQLIDPKGVTLRGTASREIETDDGKAMVSFSETVDYDNEAKVEYTTYYGSADTKWESGRYTLVIYVDNYKAGEKAYIVK